MIRSIIRLNVAAGREREFEESFRKRRVLERAKEAAWLRTGELLRPLVSGSPMWSSPPGIVLLIIRRGWIVPCEPSLLQFRPGSPSPSRRPICTRSSNNSNE